MFSPRFSNLEKAKYFLPATTTSNPWKKVWKKYCLMQLNLYWCYLFFVDCTKRRKLTSLKIINCCLRCMNKHVMLELLWKLHRQWHRNRHTHSKIHTCIHAYTCAHAHTHTCVHTRSAFCTMMNIQTSTENKYLEIKVWYMMFATSSTSFLYLQTVQCA